MTIREALKHLHNLAAKLGADTPIAFKNGDFDEAKTLFKRDKPVVHITLGAIYKTSKEPNYSVISEYNMRKSNNLCVCCARDKGTSIYVRCIKCHTSFLAGNRRRNKRLKS